MIIGTAGHIDHGKTALVRALTGVDTDRLPEEKRRGITIELGFAPVWLDGVGEASIVDVPGHEAFVRTMLAGATGVDLALLVVAADEGVMPQTREHLAILTLLGIERGVVALTKCDLVDDEWLALVESDVATVLAHSPVAAAPVVRTSATTGAGIDELRRALAAVASEQRTSRLDDDLFRLPIDRAFVVRGTGTVVTGTVWSGRLERDATVRLLPSDRRLRVRGLQTHGRSVEMIRAGERAAIALSGVELADVDRGAVLVTADAWRATRIWRAEATMLSDTDVVLQARTRVRIHLGTAETSGRVVAAGGALARGTRQGVRILLEEPLVTRGGDRFVLRSLSPVRTIGGGIVQDPMPEVRRARPWPISEAIVPNRLVRVIDEGGVSGVLLDELPVRTGAQTGAIARALDDIGAVVMRDRVILTTQLERLGEAVIAQLDAFHAAAPLELGCSLQSLRTRLGAPEFVIDEVLRELARRGLLVADGGVVRRNGWMPRLTGRQHSALEQLEIELFRSGLEPPSIGELTAVAGADTEALLQIAEREGRVCRVERERVYARVRLDDLINKLDRELDRDTTYAPTDLRAIIGVSRKYLIPLLEFFDREGLTIRHDAGRRWRGVAT
jgi:selenocysteine-specific elongation factor